MSAAPPLPGIFHTLAPILDSHGYLAVGGLLFLEDFGIPVPGETILIAAAVYAGAGRLNVYVVGIVAVLAAIAGDNVGYAIGHFGGRPLALRVGKYVLLTEEKLDTAERWFNRHGGKVVAVARFIDVLRQANGIIAGITRMHWARFAAFNALGAVLWVATWVTVGYVSGSHINQIYGVLTKVLLGLALVLVAVVVVRVVRKRRQKRAQPRDRDTASPQRR